MDSEIVLSICIPTNGIVEWVVPALESIYAQKVDNSLFEVVITDNGNSDDLCQAIKSFSYPNLHYYRTSSQGFTNQIDAFEKCSGLFCKMLNHRSQMIPGSIERLISLVCKYKHDKPIIYCAEGNAKGEDIIECENVDEFVRSLSYGVSWSAGTGVWRQDIVNIADTVTNKMFPHVLFLFGLRHNSKYVIWNEVYETMADDAGKGGYDLFHTFAVSFLDVLSDLRVNNRITCKTFVSVKKDLFRFLCSLYLYEVLLPTKHTFIIRDVADSICVYYGRYYYWKMVGMSYLRMPIICMRKIVGRY